MFPCYRCPAIAIAKRHAPPPYTPPRSPLPQVVRHGGDKRQDKFVSEALASYSDTGADADAR